MFVSDHNRSVIDQFTRQAVPFARAEFHRDEEALAQIIRVASPQKTDRVLDIACGPGIISCAFAPHVAEVTGADITPAMLVQAEKRRVESGLAPIRWVEADAERLPFADASFDLVVTRYSFHHLVAPLSVLKEMKRVCRPGGKILVVDVIPPGNKAIAYDMMETLRDPSHTHALTRAELSMMFREAGLIETDYATHGVEVELEAQLANSFPNPGDADRIREIFRDEPECDTLGVNARRAAGKTYFTYPTGVALARVAKN